MKICRFNDDRVGLIVDDIVHDVTAFARQLANDPHSGTTDPVVALARAAKTLGAPPNAAASYPLEHVWLATPITHPTKIIAAPVNYQAHIDEMASANLSPGHDIPEIGKAGFFLKATSSLIGPGEGIAVRFPERRTDHEIELVVVIGDVASNVSEGDALRHVAGYALGLDVTLRGREDRSFRKSIDSYTVVGPWLTTPDEIPDPQALQLSLTNNGEARQDASTDGMIYGVARLIAFASSFYTLHPGDIMFTGTPQGVSPIEVGDRLVASCKPLGTMTVDVRAWQIQG